VWRFHATYLGIQDEIAGDSCAPLDSAGFRRGRGEAGQSGAKWDKAGQSAEQVRGETGVNHVLPAPPSVLRGAAR